MATRPKRRRKVQSPSTDIQPSTSTNQAVEDLVRACMSSITPIIETTCRRVIEEKLSTAEIPVPQTIASSDPPPVVPTTDQSTSAEASPTLLQEMTATGTLCSSLSATPNLPDLTPSSTATLLTLGVDDKIRSKIHAGEYVKFSSLLPTDFTIPQSDNYKSIDKEGQLLFVKSNDKDPIKSMVKWTEAFHIYVAIVAEKTPTEIGNLMLYAQTIQKIADSCGDHAALLYDEKFRRWRQRDPAACPWHLKNVELYQEAVVLGLDFKLKTKKQPFRAPPKHKYCFSYNNHGTCPKGNACPHPHVCQLCAGKHWRKFCPKFKSSSKYHSNNSTNNSNKSSTTNKGSINFNSNTDL